MKNNWVWKNFREDYTTPALFGGIMVSIWALIWQNCALWRHYCRLTEYIKWKETDILRQLSLLDFHKSHVVMTWHELLELQVQCTNVLYCKNRNKFSFYKINCKPYSDSHIEVFSLTRRIV